MPLPPDPTALHPIAGVTSVAFLAPLIRNRTKIRVGDFTYVHAFNERSTTEPGAWEDACVRYAFDFIDDALEIGPFCALADDAVFILNGGNHETATISTYPFAIFTPAHDGEPGAWAAAAPEAHNRSWPNKGAIRVGPDVWIGHEARVMPGVSIGAGAVIATASVVTADVPPFTIVGGNPAREIRKRFSESDVARLLEIAWWDRGLDWITEHVDLIAGTDIDALTAAAGLEPPQDTVF